MEVKLIKLLKKTEDQDWSGKHLNVKTARNTTPDPRDSGNFSDYERKILKMESRFNIRNCDGYRGWDREYVDDNTLKIIYYFDTLEHAKNTSISRNESIRSSYIKVIQENTKDNPDIVYSYLWYIADENNHILEVLNSKGA
jgi:hypothetical protein